MPALEKQQKLAGKMKTWNLTPTQWAAAHLHANTPKQIAMNVINGNVLPWSKTLLSFTEEKDEVLDLGSGTGGTSALLAYNGRRTTLLDFSQGNLDFSFRLFEILGLSCRYFKADMKKVLPFDNNSFDTVFTIGVLEYFSEEEIKHVLQEAFRITRKKVVIMVPNAACLLYRVGRWYSKVTHQWKWGGERPFYSFTRYFESIENARIFEFTLGTKQSIEFLSIFGGSVKRMLFYILRSADDSRPSRFRQGFVLVSIGVKKQISD